MLSRLPWLERPNAQTLSIKRRLSIKRYSSVRLIQGLKSLIVHNFCFLRTTTEKKKKKEVERKSNVVWLQVYISFIITEVVQRWELYCLESYTHIQLFYQWSTTLTELVPKISCVGHLPSVISGRNVYWKNHFSLYFSEIFNFYICCV